MSNAANVFFCFSTSAFGPYFFKRAWTSASVKPVLSSAPSFASVSAIVGAVPVASGVCMNNSSSPQRWRPVITFRIVQDQKNFGASWDADPKLGEKGTPEFSLGRKSDTATDLLSRERIVYAYMRSLRERI